MLSPQTIQEAIFKAVDVIVEKRLKSLQLNYCILGIVASKPLFDEQKEIYYMINYQDTLIKGYPVTSGTKFQQEDATGGSVGSQFESTLEVIEGDNTIDLINREMNLVGVPSYKEGDLVYTLVINGDLSKKRLILCKA